MERPSSCLLNEGELPVKKRAGTGSIYIIMCIGPAVTGAAPLLPQEDEGALLSRFLLPRAGGTAPG